MPDAIQISADVVVVDLEGTTSAAGFILGDLYDYARPRLEAVLGRDDDTVRRAAGHFPDGGLADLVMASYIVEARTRLRIASDRPLGGSP